VYGYYGGSNYGYTLGVQQYGGLSFDIQPYDAGVFVDGEYVGTVGTFTPSGEPLTLWPGVHHIAIVCDGFRTMEWDVTVQPGQVIPYRGMLSRW
jgi:archaellum component FlaG (FlaF/FlaG flagellin family)